METLKKMMRSEKYSSFAVPIDDLAEIRDATYFLREDGTFAFSEGYCHEPNRPPDERRLLSHIVFVPDRGNAPDYAYKNIFGADYENVTKPIMATQPLRLFYPLQLREYLKVDPSLDVPKPFYARYKVLVPVNTFVAHFPPRHSLRAIIERADSDPAAMSIAKVTEATAELIQIEPDQIGVSGSLSLGTYANPHDVDYVIYATVKEIRRIVKFIYKLTGEKEERKVFEFGKFWPLRFWERYGGEKIMVCPFFSYLDLDEAPLRNFSFEDCGPVVVEGVVCDDTHNCFNPTVLGLESPKIDGKSYRGELKLILYHGGERGDYVEGDHLCANGHFGGVTTYGDGGLEVRERFGAVMVTNLEDVTKIV